MKYVFIHDQRFNHDIKTLCRVLDVSRSGYYKWRNRRQSDRDKIQEQLLVRIQEIFEDSRQTYGCPRIYDQLRKEGFECNYKVVERLMRDNGIHARRKRKFVRTTDSRHALPVAPNVLNREFKVDHPDEVWVTDITYGAPRTHFGVRMTGMQPTRKEVIIATCHVLRCGRTRAQAAVTCCRLAG